MRVTFDQTIRRKLFWLQPGEVWAVGVLTVTIHLNHDTMRWVIRGEGVVQTFRYPRRDGRRTAARIEIAAYILGHYQGEGVVDRRKWRAA